MRRRPYSAQVLDGVRWRSLGTYTSVEGAKRRCIGHALNAPARVQVRVRNSRTGRTVWTPGLQRRASPRRYRVCHVNVKGSCTKCVYYVHLTRALDACWTYVAEHPDGRASVWDKEQDEYIMRTIF